MKAARLDALAPIILNWHNDESMAGIELTVVETQHEWMHLRPIMLHWVSGTIPFNGAKQKTRWNGRSKKILIKRGL